MLVLSRLTAYLRAKRMWPLARGGVVRGPQIPLPLVGEVPSEQTAPPHFPCYARSPAGALAWAMIQQKYEAERERNRQALEKALKPNSQWMDTVPPMQGDLFDNKTEPAQPTEPVQSADFNDTSGFGL